MAWNYRIMKHLGCFVAIHSTYYDEQGKVNGWSRDGEMTPVYDSLEDMQAQLKAMLRAFDKPVLDYETGLEIETPKPARERAKQTNMFNWHETVRYAPGIEPGAWSGCDQSGGDCPNCGK